MSYQVPSKFQYNHKINNRLGPNPVERGDLSRCKWLGSLPALQETRIVGKKWRENKRAVCGRRIMRVQRDDDGDGREERKFVL